MRSARTRKSPASAPSATAFDIAVVGMGAAGLYTAWRLCNAQNDELVFGTPARQLKLAIYDTQTEDRVGGRLCTQPLPGYPFLAELGGMRFRSNQLLVSGLVEALGLSEQVQTFHFSQHFYFLREKRLLQRDFKDISRLHPVYSLEEKDYRRKKKGEEPLLPESLIEHAIHQTLRSLDFNEAWANSRERSEWNIRIDRLKRKIRSIDRLTELSPREWATIQRYGVYRRSSFLPDVGFWDLLQFQLSSGAWHLAHDGLGYESVMGNWNAAVALPWFIQDFATPGFKTLKTGMKSIATRLYEEIVRRGVEYKHGYDLVAIDLQSVADSSESLFRLHFVKDGDPVPKIVFARSVVLALPKGALVRIKFGDSLMERVSVPKFAPRGFDGRLWFSDLLHSVDARALFKLFLGYSFPWWTKTTWWKERQGQGCSLPVHGKVNTDLPLRQVYYYGKDQWNEARRSSLTIDSKTDHHSMLMASYSDSHYIEFWSELKKEPGYRYQGFKNRTKLSDDDAKVHEEFGAPLSMIVRAEHQLGLLHGERVSEGNGEPRAEVGLYMEWSRPPYYAGWHSWKVGVKPWEVSENIMAPFGDLKIFICGEAYSTEQGWVEGALKSAEKLLTLKFGLSLSPETLGSRFDHDTRKLLHYVGAVDYERQKPATGV